MGGPLFNADQFRKCISLAEGGATEGERQAGHAAAARVAAAAGLSVEEAHQRAGGLRKPFVQQHPVPPTSWKPATRRTPPRPQTVADVLAEKAREHEHRKRHAAKAERRWQRFYAEQEVEIAKVREKQAERDCAWAEAKATMTN